MPDLEMLPCPFCGEDARHSTYQDESLWNHNTVPWHVIGCPRCEIEMRQCDGFDDILASWNSRPRVDELEAERNDLAATVRRLVHDIQREHPYSDHAAQAADYLRRHNLQGSILRDE